MKLRSPLTNLRLARLSALATPVLLLLTDCAPPTMPSATFLARTLAPKAAFDLQCPEAQLRFTDIVGTGAVGDGSYNDAPTVFVDHVDYQLDRNLSRQQGVTGCSRHASYSYLRGVWVGSESVPAADPTPSSAK